jgi:hypothetical protein
LLASLAYGYMKAWLFATTPAGQHLTAVTTACDGGKKRLLTRFEHVHENLPHC